MKSNERTPLDALLPQIMDVIDRVELVAPTPEPEPLRARLTRAVEDTFSSQGIEASPQAIAKAVEDHLTQGTLAVPPGKQNGTRFDFGWRRPRHLNELARAQVRRRRWWNRYVHWIYKTHHPTNEADAMVIHSIGLGALTASPILGGMIAAGLDPFLVTVIPMIVGVVASFVWAGVLFPLAKRLGGSQETDPFRESEPKDATLQQWLALPEAREYVRACFASDVPFLLEGDFTQLCLMIEAEAQRKKAARQAEIVQHQAQAKLARRKQVQAMFTAS